jgi:hypothetical protein
MPLHILLMLGALLLGSRGITPSWNEDNCKSLDPSCTMHSPVEENTVSWLPHHSSILSLLLFILAHFHPWIQLRHRVYICIEDITVHSSLGLWRAEAWAKYSTILKKEFNFSCGARLQCHYCMYNWIKKSERRYEGASFRLKSWESEISSPFVGRCSFIFWRCLTNGQWQ